MPEKNKTKVGIIRGGAGEHYMSSLRKGGEIISYIFENLSDKYKTVDILVDREGIWHANGIPTTLRDLENKVDVVWNTSRHPNISSVLSGLSTPSVENKYFFENLKNNNTLRASIEKIGVKVPRFIVSPKNAREVFEKFSSPWIVKINNEVKIAKTFNELAEAIDGKDNVIVEEFIIGKVASAHSVAGFRKEDIYVFPLINASNNFLSSEKEKLINLAKDLHKHIGAKHYLKFDFVLNNRSKVYLLNMEEMPDLKQGSHFEEACESVGAKMHHVVSHILEKALEK